jgi:hypothetical protein
MIIILSDAVAPCPVSGLRQLVSQLRDDHFELVDDLFPLDVDLHVMHAILVLDALISALNVPSLSASEVLETEDERRDTSPSASKTSLTSPSLTWET